MLLFFESNLSLVLHVKVFLAKEACNVILQTCKQEEITFPRTFISWFIPYFIGQYCQQTSEVGGSE